MKKKNRFTKISHFSQKKYIFAFRSLAKNARTFVFFAKFRKKTNAKVGEKIMRKFRKKIMQKIREKNNEKISRKNIAKIERMYCGRTGRNLKR